MSAALRVYLAASCLLGTLAPALLRRRQARGKEDPARLGERLGRPGMPRPDGRLIWLHGASIGEAVSALPLIDALLARSDARVLMTTGTVTSARRMASALPERAMHQFVPVDTASAVRGFLDHWRPDLAIWIESELWPRLIVETARRGIPMALVNARVSARSASRWDRARRMAQTLFGHFRVILTQDQETGARLQALGVASRFGGNLKALVELPAPDPAELARLRGAIAGRPVWLAASTHAGEEEFALDAHQPGALLILAPRHPERAEGIASLLRDRGIPFARRSTGEVPGSETRVYLADTLGEMGLWYRLAPITFVGGSLMPRGGHTPFEPISCGSAVLHGPHVENFAPAYAALAEAACAGTVRDAAALAEVVDGLLADGAAAADMARKAAVVHAALKPDVGALADEMRALMEGA